MKNAEIPAQRRVDNVAFVPAEPQVEYAITIMSTDKIEEAKPLIQLSIFLDQRLKGSSHKKELLLQSLWQIFWRNLKKNTSFGKCLSIF
jgi:hypothetical protein